MFYIPTNNDVVIIGAGPVGLMTANLLGLYGLKVLLIERNNQPYDVPRAITLDDEGCRTLQAVELDDIYLPNALPSRGSRYYGENGEPFAEVGPGPVEYGFPRRTQIFQPEFDTTVKQLRSHRDQIILIRPDRYVAASFDQYNYKQVIPKLSSLLS